MSASETRAQSARAQRARAAVPARPSAGDVVAEHVRELIFEGELRQGDKVPQQEIAEALGVSRIPVREALVALERDGFVTIEPHRGAFVNAFDAEAIEDHYELYGLVYGHAARRSAERSSEADLEWLRELRARIAAPSAEAPEELLALAGAFRDAIQRAGNSPRLRALMSTLAGIVPGNFFETVPESIPVARRGLRGAIDAIEARDGDAAAEHCLAMMREHAKNVVALIARRGLASR